MLDCRFSLLYCSLQSLKLRLGRAEMASNQTVTGEEITSYGPRVATLADFYGSDIPLSELNIRPTQDEYHWHGRKHPEEHIESLWFGVEGPWGRLDGYVEPEFFPLLEKLLGVRS